MSIFTRFISAFSKKESLARQASTVRLIGRPISTPVNYESLSKEGYSKNAVVYTCIQKIAQSCSSIRWVLYSKRGGELVELIDHPLLKLLERPNPLQSQSEFFESVVGFRQISGNSYIEENKVNGKVLELWPVRPDKMKIIPNRRGYVQQYQFNYGGNIKTWDVDQVTLRSSILHMRTFNPLNDWYGMSPLEAAILALDSNNTGQRWNLALLQNSATPSGVLQMNTSVANPRGQLTDDQFKRLKEEFEENYQGAKNAGRPMVIEGGLSWQSISLSPKEMEFVKAKEVSATDLMMVLGVPPEILGHGQKTFNNYKEARLSFYEETVLPIEDKIKDSLNAWLVPQFGEDLFLDYDKDSIEALQLRREQRYTSLSGVNFLTINEKREQCGYEEIEGGDELALPSASPFGSFDFTDDEDESTPPPKDEDENDDGVDETEDLDEDDDDKSMEWKTINLLTANEKRKSYVRQNKKRKSLAFHFYKELNEDFKDLTKDLMKVSDELKGADSKVIEIALIKACEDKIGAFTKTISRHTKYTLEAFGRNVFRDGKSLNGFIETKANLKFDMFIQSYIERATAHHIKTIVGTNEKAVRRIVKEWVYETINAGDSLPELSKFLQMEFESLSPGRARTIARTEVATASNNGALGAAKALGVSGLFKEWISANDGRVRDGDKGGPDHASMNGVAVPLDEKFTVPPDASMDCPGDDSADASQVINCRCVTVFSQRG